ncbi:MAG: LLM class flavin-dependent oxidoreductase [Xanthobacteraceae bacterium]
MNELPTLSIRVDGSMLPAECVELAKAAETAGLAGVWFAENAFARGILPAATACALATEKIRINAGVFNPFSRHPAMMAMEIGPLDEISNGRASISIGAGIASATARLGLSGDRPLPALRDTLAIVRGLLEGREVDYTGAVFSARKVKLDYQPRQNIPVYLAGRGNLTVKLAGAAADGLMISNMCSVDFAGHSADLMRSSGRTAGRDTPGRAVQYMPCCTHPQSDEALKAAKRTVGEMLPRFWALGQRVGSAKEALLAGTKISEADYADASSRIRAGEDAADVLDERHVTAFSLYGTPNECLMLARKYRAAGIDELALTFSGSNAKDQIAAIGEALSRARSG